jgi:tetratricopeptide (TPR) repeat protein
MPDVPVHTATIFVSSPDDVAPERGRVQAVAAKLNREFEGIIRFETVLWEEQFYKADRSFQPQIPPAVACDIVVSIFWTRIGTELPADFPRMPDGRRYPSGTAYELLTALEASKAKGVPDVYVFRKAADVALPVADAERRRQAQTQLDALEEFWSEWFRSENGEFKAAFQTFLGTDAFEQRIELLLRQWLDTRGVLGPRLTWPKEKGSPFRGLAPFEAEHAAVFFGRDRAIDEARRRLVGGAERSTSYLLIVGASGSGKSSLARAGLIPRLTTPGVVETVDVWRVALMKPSEGRAGPLASLATALFVALPELAKSDFPNPAALVDLLRHGGKATAQPVVHVLAGIGEAAQRERHSDQPMRTALVLLVDQLEELFAQAVDTDEHAEFVESLKELVASGQVWAVTTLRADFYELMLKQPGLKGMKEGGATLDLGPPGPAELVEIVRAPPAAAGLVFESNAKGELDERLLADAKTADSLPLLQFTLRQLYERRIEVDGQWQLTHAAYDALGGLQGAIAAEAERAVADLPAKTVDVLPRLLRRLAGPGHDGNNLTLREVAQADVAAEPDETALAGALLGARILIAGTDAAGHATLRLAHDAVFATWPRAAAAAQASREFYRVRSEVEHALRLWREHNRPKDRLIQPGVPLAEAEKLVADFGRELPGELTGYVAASRKRENARQRLIAAAAMFFFCLAVIATGVGIWAYREREAAVVAEQHALAERDKATRSFRLAQQTAESLVFDIAQGLRNFEGMRAETARKILSTAAATFDALAASAPDNLELQRSGSVMLNEFGDTYLTLGDLTQALKSYRDGLAVAERLAKADPSNTGWQRDLSVSYDKIGDVLTVQSNLGEALASYRRSLAIAERLAEADSSNTGWQSESYEKIGDVLQAQGDLGEALKSYGDGLAVAERLAKADPSNTGWQRDFSVSYSRVGDVLMAQGNLEEALRSYRDGLAIRERLAKADPTNTEWQRDLSVSYEKIGDVLKAQGNLGEALKSCRDSLTIRQRLAKADPANTVWLRDLSVSYDKIGDVLQAQGNLEEALKSYRETFTIAERLAKADPENTVWQRDLAVSDDKIGDVLQSQGDLREALTSYRDSLAIWGSLAKAEHGNMLYQRDLRFSIDRLGGLAFRLVLARDFVSALESADQAIPIAPDKIWLYANRAHALMFLGRVDEARVLYLRYRGERDVLEGKSWETILLEDFTELRKSGLTHPLMDEILRQPDPQPVGPPALFRR